jgi:hypothetical protein
VRGGRRTVVGAGVDGEVDVAVDLLRLGGDGLGAAEGAGLVGAANVELVVVRGERLQVIGLELWFISICF